MKKTLTIIFSIVLLTSCTNKKKTLDKPITKEAIQDSTKKNLRGPIDIKFWDKTPSLNDRIATKSDVENGLAVFSIEDNEPGHKVYNTPLPKLANLIDSETKAEELVVVIQIETTSKGTIVGYRRFGGGDGACFLYELKFLDAQQIKQIVGN